MEEHHEEWANDLRGLAKGANPTIAEATERVIQDLKERADWDAEHPEEAAARLEGEKALERERERRGLAERSVRAGVPKRAFLDATRGRFELHPTVATWVARQGREDSPWFYLAGGTGSGKTTTAARAWLELSRRGIHAAFVNARALQQAWDGGTNYGTKDRQTKAEAIAPYKSAPVLFLDGLGEEFTSRSFVACLFDLIGHRSDNLLPMFITSQHSFNDYRARMFEKTQDREMCAAITSRIVGGMGGEGGCLDNFLALDAPDHRAA